MDAAADLPIWFHKDEILSKLKSSQVLLLSGETGSGKSTLLPKILYENGYRDSTIVVTQPRRVAVISLARHVASMLNCDVGNLVGFAVRFLNCCSEETKIKYVTDGVLLREVLDDSLFSKYSVVVIDEAHERSIRTDVLLGILRTCIPKRRDLKVIVMSATLQATAFATFFKGCSVVRVPGRTFPLDTYYAPHPQEDYLEAAMVSVLQINLTYKHGDVLVFLPGQDDIESLEHMLCDKLKVIKDFIKTTGETADGNVEDLREVTEVLLGDTPYEFKNWKELEIVPLYAALPLEQQSRVFRAPSEGYRKVVLATNIAETSVTIPGIRFVVDSGLVKQKLFSVKNCFESLMLQKISKDSANQRAGRAGRMGPGKVFRLYTMDAFKTMRPTRIPEIRCTNVAHVYLELKMLGVKNPLDFPLIDPPSKSALLTAAMELYRLDALDCKGNLTEVGKKMGRIPLLPRHARLLLSSAEFGCTSEVLTIVSMLSTDLTLFSSEKHDKEAFKMRKNITNPSGDHLSLLNMYTIWSEAPNKRECCAQFGFNPAAFKRASEIRAQLAEVLTKRLGFLNIAGCKDSSEWDNVLRCLCKGGWMNLASLNGDGKSYKIEIQNREVGEARPEGERVVRRDVAVWRPQSVRARIQCGRCAEDGKSLLGRKQHLEPGDLAGELVLQHVAGVPPAVANAHGRNRADRPVGHVGEADLARRGGGLAHGVGPAPDEGGEGFVVLRREAVGPGAAPNTFHAQQSHGAAAHLHLVRVPLGLVTGHFLPGQGVYEVCGDPGGLKLAFRDAHQPSHAVVVNFAAGRLDHGVHIPEAGPGALDHAHIDEVGISQQAGSRQQVHTGEFLHRSQVGRDQRVAERHEAPAVEEIHLVDVGRLKV
ncbi:ATP-dependent helicase [Babesia caballi]|uniref:RNA helicase n=1 Tax=Babesia caballi TaxID=5871 RepID=A0AAV4LVS1_BABCB|nr:ATP-dependent helicase [Babesia caballi]